MQVGGLFLCTYALLWELRNQLMCKSLTQNLLIVSAERGVRVTAGGALGRNPWIVGIYDPKPVGAIYRDKSPPRAPIH